MGRSPGATNVTNAERLEIQRRARARESHRAIAAAVGRERVTVWKVLAEAGGLMPRRFARSALRLSLAEREEISRGLRAGESYRSIARRLGRAPSTIAREVRSNRGRPGTEPGGPSCDAIDRPAGRGPPGSPATRGCGPGSRSSSANAGRPSRSRPACAGSILATGRCG